MCFRELDGGIAFSDEWGFGNVLNGFVYFNEIQIIFSWILMFAFSFVPNALMMVGELGSAFKISGGVLYIRYVFNRYVYYGIEHHYSDCADSIRHDYGASCQKGEGEKFSKIVCEV